MYTATSHAVRSTRTSRSIGQSIRWALPSKEEASLYMSFDYILQLVDTQKNSDTVKKAIVIGLSTQYHWQIKFKEDTPVHKYVEPTPEEVLIAWETHTLDIAEPGNIEKVKDAVMLTFGFYITRDEVELLKRFSTLNKVSVFETNTWRQMMCFKCCPKKALPESPIAQISGKENLRKCKNDDSQDDDQPGSKRPALSASEVASSTDLAVSKPTNDGQSPDSPEHAETAPPATTSSADLVPNTSPNVRQAAESSEAIDTAQQNRSATTKNSISEAFSTTLVISSWLRLLPTFKLHSGKTSTTIEKWLKDSFVTDAT